MTPRQEIVPSSSADGTKLHIKAMREVSQYRRIR